MKNSIKALLFSAIAFIPVAAFSQNTTATDAGAKQPTTVKSPEKAKKTKAGGNSDDAQYNVSKRNKKVGKQKYEVCETKEIEKGSSKGEIKTICTPKK